MIQASQELFDILEKNGLRNKSYLYVSECGDRYKGFPFNPRIQKKVFGLGTGMRRLNINFDYHSMTVSENGIYITDTYLKLDERKLRSIISYFHCNRTKQSTLKEYCGGKIEYAGDIMEQRREGRILCGPFDSKFEKIYMEVLI
jgi:hypothetical protein